MLLKNVNEQNFFSDIIKTDQFDMSAASTLVGKLNKQFKTVTAEEI